MIILKYEIPIDEDRFTIQMPIDSYVLCVQVQRDRPVIWVLADQKNPQEARQFILRGTGMLFDYLSNTERYIGTFQTTKGYFVGHLFEL